MIDNFCRAAIISCRAVIISCQMTVTIRRMTITRHFLTIVIRLLTFMGTQESVRTKTKVFAFYKKTAGPATMQTRPNN